MFSTLPKEKNSCPHILIINFLFFQVTIIETNKTRKTPLKDLKNWFSGGNKSIPQLLPGRQSSCMQYLVMKEGVSISECRFLILNFQAYVSREKGTSEVEEEFRFFLYLALILKLPTDPVLTIILKLLTRGLQLGKYVLISCALDWKSWSLPQPYGNPNDQTFY